LGAISKLAAIEGWDAPKQTVSVSRNSLSMTVVSPDKLESIQQAVDSARREIAARDGDAIDVAIIAPGAAGEVSLDASTAAPTAGAPPLPDSRADVPADSSSLQA
jgi:hypothetical protein